MDNSKLANNDNCDPEPSEELKQWLSERGIKAENLISKTTYLRDNISIDKWNDAMPRSYILTSVKLKDLSFINHDFNPRTPNEDRVKELAASISQLTLLSPLTCVSFREPNDDPNIGSMREIVYLIDGRHRFSALDMLREKKLPGGKKFEDEIDVDLKIFFDLDRSDAFLMANYLNRSRRQLKPGEYYGSIVNIYNEKEREIINRKANATIPSEVTVFRAITNELKNKNADLSIGRIVGSIAFDSEQDDSWYGYVGIDQGEPIKINGSRVNGCYKPMTAGILFHLLKSLCYPKPYDDNGRNRATELGNVVELGKLYRDNVFKDEYMIRKRTPTTAAYVACKTYVSMAFGELLDRIIRTEYTELRNAKSVFGDNGVSFPYDVIEKSLKGLMKIMDTQAKDYNMWMASDKKDRQILENVWSYQTQKEHVLRGLEPAMEQEMNMSIWNYD